MISLNNISHAYGSQIIFDNASITFSPSDRCGLVGLNGTGKSTLLRFIAEQEKPDEGSISRDEQMRIAYLPQHNTTSSTKSVIDDLIDEQIEKNGEASWAESKKTLAGLGFSEEMMHQAVTTLSTGWKMRLLLAKLLVQKADFYLFDEPTNHLDLPTREWFISFLQQARFGFIIVSHDKHVLDSLCTSIVSLQQHMLVRYKGNYSSYEAQKQIDNDLQQKRYEEQQKERARKRATAERFRAQASKAKMAQAILKQLGREEILMPPSESNPQIQLSFPSVAVAPRTILTLNNVAHRFNTHELFDHVSFRLERHDHAAIVAPNGIGKTTLIKLIAKDLDLQLGNINWSEGVQYAVFHQEQSITFDERKTIWDTVNGLTKKSDSFVRMLLGALLFSDDTIYKPISVLSGGERVRVALAQLLVRDANVLILDEPTNHLDIPAQEALLGVLRGYPGTILFVSHDYDFLNNLATKIIELRPNGSTTYSGNYESYKAQRQYEHSIAASDKQIDQSVLEKPAAPTKLTNQPKKATPPPAALAHPIDQKKLAQLEKQIEREEHAKELLVKKLETIEYDSPAFSKTCSQIVEYDKKIEELLMQWQELYQK